jgi:hypothetical protein
MTFVLQPAPPPCLTGDRREDARRREAWRRQHGNDRPDVPLSPRALELAALRRRLALLDEAAALELELAWPKTVERLRRVGVAVAPARRRRRRPAVGYVVAPRVLTR